MNKKQYAITILLVIGTLLYFSVGESQPASSISNIVVYVCAGIAGFVVLSIIMPARYCPSCGTKLPKIRFPKNANELFFGWTTCPNCKSELDNNGRIVNR